MAIIAAILSHHCEMVRSGVPSLVWCFRDPSKWGCFRFSQGSGDKFEEDIIKLVPMVWCVCLTYLPFAHILLISDRANIYLILVF